MILALLVLACGVEPQPQPQPEPTHDDDAYVPLEPPRLLRRVSLDLRGVLPTAEELDQVEADPAALEGLIDQWLQSPQLEDRLVLHLGDRFLTRLDEYEARYSDFRLDPAQEYSFLRAVAEEPLRLMARVVVEDRPWTDIVTADQTVANELLAEIWPLEYPDGATGWQWSTYTDGRPAGGILATNGLWWRYVTSPSNKNRSRVSAISTLLLCEDILSRPVSFGQALSIEEDPEEAISQVDACMACHASVEPVAATLFGFYWYTQYSAAEMSRYHPEREVTGIELLGVQPAWYGQPLQTLADLGPAVASDPRFARCAAETVATILWRRPVATADFGAVERLREVYLGEGQQLKAVLRAALLTPRYQAGALSEEASADARAREVTERLLTPLVMAEALEELTGFRWVFDGWDQLDNDVVGYRVLAGGVDGYAITSPQNDPGLTWSLATRRLAEAAADHVTRAELLEGGERGLFTAVTAESRPEDPEFEAELRALSWRLFGERADEAWLAQAAALWTDAYALGGDPVLAWSTTLAAFFRDPRFVTA